MMAIGMLSPCNLTPLLQSSCLKKNKKFGSSFLGRRKTGTTFCPRTLVTSKGEFWGSCKAFEFLEVTQWMNASSFFFIFSSVILIFAFILQLQLFIHLINFIRYENIEGRFHPLSNLLQYIIHGASFIIIFSSTI